MNMVPPSVDVALSAIENPVPAGSGLMAAAIVALWLTSIEPVLENEAGPETRYATELSVPPPATSSDILTAPTSPTRVAGPSQEATDTSSAPHSARVRASTFPMGPAAANGSPGAQRPRHAPRAPTGASEPTRNRRPHSDFRTLARARPGKVVGHGGPRAGISLAL